MISACVSTVFLFDPAYTAILACIFFGLVLVAKATGHWQTTLPREMSIDLVSPANDAAHPGM
jgi:hypothetical protein